MRFSFQPTEYLASEESEPQLGTFFIPVLADSSIKGVNVLLNGKLLASTSASANPPTVQVVFPNGGESLAGNRATLEWIGNDPDGNSLTYLVEYSRDGGVTWETLVIDWPEQTYEIELESLAETREGLIRVMASDGFNAITDDSDGFFSTPNNAPIASIFSPIQGNLFIGVQQIFFEGVAIDSEDGQLSGTSLAWTSNLDGSLGNSENFNIEASKLSEGTHVITLTATDSGGLTDGASVVIDVFRLVSPTYPPPIVDAGPDHEIFSGETITENITFRDISGDDSPWVYTIDWSDGTSDSDSTNDQTLPIVASHQYFDSGEYTVKACITDTHGATGCDTQIVRVSFLIHIDGPPVPVEINRAGQDGRLRFDGNMGQRVNLGVSDVSFGGAFVDISILSPDGTPLASAVVGGIGGDIDIGPLPATGAYTIVVDPR